MGFSKSVEAHHWVEAEPAHHFLHHIGQPHEHGHDADVTLSFSQDAVEHSNSFNEGCTTGILDIPALVVSEHVPYFAHVEYQGNWASPFLRQAPPPPRA